MVDEYPLQKFKKEQIRAHALTRNLLLKAAEN